MEGVDVVGKERERERVCVCELECISKIFVRFHICYATERKTKKVQKRIRLLNKLQGGLGKLVHKKQKRLLFFCWGGGGLSGPEAALLKLP